MRNSREEKDIDDYLDGRISKEELDRRLAPPRVGFGKRLKGFFRFLFRGEL